MVSKLCLIIICFTLCVRLKLNIKRINLLHLACNFITKVLFPKHQLTSNEGGFQSEYGRATVVPHD